ncbi:phosphate ABC transporter, permease protein PstA [Brevirhabdus pacifica]|uniref:Phosphate transport system permease protein PstA n=1 Tax=Brevirhabdus pacifica TaxID=1267768 RepID=A0A1U7DLP1_9RHOB|nr:phosphate ABC transporter, permease protein PstA [Brevirhabdus pacifica]OWU80337.1 hypothetical protein ATO5_02260 [Loktanella sp. 22II-4b]
MHGGPEAARRLRGRRRAETRLRIYGQMAIGLAALALVALLWSVVGKASGALTEHYVTLPVTLDAKELGLKEPEPTPQQILRSDFNGLTKDTLRVRFPTVKGRSEKRELYDLLSGGASFELAEMVTANPSLLGQTIEFRFLASDVADLYLKGDYGTLEPMETSGTLTVTLDDDEATLTSSSAEDFASVLGQVRASLLDRAARLQRQADRQQAGVEAFTRRAEAAEDAETRESNQALAAERTANRDKLLAEVADLKTRAEGGDAAEALNDANDSLFVRLGGGWVRIESLTSRAATGAVMAPLTELEGAGAGPVEVADWQLMRSTVAAEARKVSDAQIVWLEDLREKGAVDQVFNWRLFSASDSREPELAGIWGAAVGTFWTMLVTFALAFPIGVLSAIYLEEFAPRNRWTDFIEVNINNLAAVPSIVFGLLGLAVFLGVFGVPRSAPLAGGIVLALMTLPTVIIASRASIRAVPPSIRDAALGLGASRLQTSFHHVLPLAMPGILTGTIIGMAQALGETAPLILIGMVAFIVDVPGGITDSATVLPVQVYRWSDFPERAFEARTAAAICVLLAFLVVMNALAVFLRRRFERRW